jgi:hypothetical protein
VYQLAANVDFDRVVVDVSLVSKLKMPLPKFVAARKYDEDDVQFLARIELEAEGMMGSYTHLEHNTCITSLRNGGHLNHVFELVGVDYRPRPVPSSDAFTESSKKRKVDATGKASVKCLRVYGKKKGESVKAAASRGKTSLKRPSDAEVASMRPVKLSKKIVPRPVAAASTTRVAIGASGPKSAIGASGSKGAPGASGSKGAAGAKKVVAPIQKRRVPAIGVMAEESSTESHESLPHDQMPQDSTPEFASRSGTHGQMLEAALRPEPESSL